MTKAPNPPPPEGVERPDPPPPPPPKKYPHQEIRILPSEEEARAAVAVDISPDRACEGRFMLCSGAPPSICAMCLKAKFGYWGEHPDFPLESWRSEVENNDTRHGYWEWVSNEMGLEENDKL